MPLPESLLVVIVSTLSGGLERGPLNVSGHACDSMTCAAGVRWPECYILNELVTPQQLVGPWVVTLGVFGVLCMPTLLLRSKRKEEGLRLVAQNLILFLGLLMCSTVVTDHPVVCYTIGIHSCVRFFTQLDVSPALVGGIGWWSLRYAAVAGMLGAALSFGPSVSVVRWPSTPQGGALQCAYLSHLVGCIVPDMVSTLLSYVLALLETFRCFSRVSVY
jgi:hypothetical protein